MYNTSYSSLQAWCLWFKPHHCLVAKSCFITHHEAVPWKSHIATAAQQLFDVLNQTSVLVQGGMNIFPLVTAVKSNSDTSVNEVLKSIFAFTHTQSFSPESCTGPFRLCEHLLFFPKPLSKPLWTSSHPTKGTAVLSVTANFSKPEKIQGQNPKIRAETMQPRSKWDPTAVLIAQTVRVSLATYIINSSPKQDNTALTFFYYFMIPPRKLQSLMRYCSEHC